MSLVEELQQRFLPGVELGQVACHMVGIMCTHEGMSKLRCLNNHSRPPPLSISVEQKNPEPAFYRGTGSDLCGKIESL